MKPISFCAGLIVFLTITAAAPGVAQERVRAYVLIEMSDAADVESIHGALGALPNCKVLVDSLISGESVAHVDCRDMESLSRVVVEEIPGMEGVSRVTMWAVEKPE